MGDGLGLPSSRRIADKDTGIATSHPAGQPESGSFGKGNAGIDHVAAQNDAIGKISGETNNQYAPNDSNNGNVHTAAQQAVAFDAASRGVPTAQSTGDGGVKVTGVDGQQRSYSSTGELQGVQPSQTKSGIGDTPVPAKSDSVPMIDGRTPQAIDSPDVKPISTPSTPDKYGDTQQPIAIAYKVSGDKVVASPPGGDSVVYGKTVGNKVGGGTSSYSDVAAKGIPGIGDGQDHDGHRDANLSKWGLGPSGDNAAKGPAGSTGPHELKTPLGRPEATTYSAGGHDATFNSGKMDSTSGDKQGKWGGTGGNGKGAGDTNDQPKVVPISDSPSGKFSGSQPGKDGEGFGSGGKARSDGGPGGGKSGGYSSDDGGVKAITGTGSGRGAGSDSGGKGQGVGGSGRGGSSIITHGEQGEERGDSGAKPSKVAQANDDSPESRGGFRIGDGTKPVFDKSTSKALLEAMDSVKQGKPIDGKALGLDEKATGKLNAFLKQLDPEKLVALKQLLTLGADGKGNAMLNQHLDNVLRPLSEIIGKNSTRILLDNGAERDVPKNNRAVELSDMFKEYNNRVLALKDLFSRDLQNIGDKLGTAIYAVKLQPTSDLDNSVKVSTEQPNAASISQKSNVQNLDDDGDDPLHKKNKQEGVQLKEQTGKLDNAGSKDLDPFTLSLSLKEQIAGQKGSDQLTGMTDLADKLAQNNKLEPKLEPQKEKHDTEKERAEAEKNRQLESQLIINTSQANKEEDGTNKEESQTREDDNQALLDDKRVKYKIKDKDTLESIASRNLNDAALSGLIYDINKDAIPVKKVCNKDLLHMPVGQVIWLPSQVEIKDYRSKLLQATKSKFEYLDAGRFEESLKQDDVLPANAESTVDQNDQLNQNWEDKLRADALALEERRRANIEKVLGPLEKKVETDANGRIRYVVRLGDTLKSIAIRHPSLGNVSYWKVIAHVNNLPTTVNTKGVPLTVLQRGMIIWLPTEHDIARHQQNNSQAISSQLRSTTRGTGGAPLENNVSLPADLATKVCPSCQRVTVSSAFICSGCSYTFNNDLSAKSDKIEAIMTELPNTTSQGIAPVTGPEEQDLLQQEIRQFMEQLADTIRLVKSGSISSPDVGFKARLEVLTNDSWRTVVSYEVYDDISLRHEFTLDGQKKTIRIDLPPSAVHELAENDIATNWKRYSDKFLAGESISD